MDLQIRFKFSGSCLLKKIASKCSSTNSLLDLFCFESFFVYLLEHSIRMAILTGCFSFPTSEAYEKQVEGDELSVNKQSVSSDVFYENSIQDILDLRNPYFLGEYFYG